MDSSLNRRQALSVAAVAALASSTSLCGSANADQPAGGEIRFCLNTSTIRGQKLSLVEEVEIAGKAGYSGIEPWLREIREYEKQGGDLGDLKKRIKDAGLRVESAIGFAGWIVDDDEKRAAALESAKRDMEAVRAIGGSRIAAPPVGATRSDVDLFKAAERYAALLHVGAKVGVTPQLELWGFSQTLHRLGELLLVGIESAHPDACLLPDVYHIFKGGSEFDGLKLINGSRIHCFHMNDYPAEPPRAEMRDADRVYPGDGVAPLKQIISDLHIGGFRGAFSLELFNPTYWGQDAALVARTGLEKMKQAVSEALG
ncbi:MAG: sugar phosphate isomerase/epimerase [Pirellulaceae bacterium]|jgi:sugar phosphate isomerase/epimerase|nr:sugar phosphate isomerase/epimerase [Pirellulaceae bacterium]MDP7020478.1 sugar phosphate isomerase/epimerase [Pirellulaceae bacterium]